LQVYHTDHPPYLFAAHSPWCSTFHGFVSDSWSLYVTVTEMVCVGWCWKEMYSKMSADKAKSHGLSATALLEETLQSITYLLIYGYHCCVFYVVFGCCSIWMQVYTVCCYKWNV